MTKKTDSPEESPLTSQAQIAEQYAARLGEKIWTIDPESEAIMADPEAPALKITESTELSDPIVESAQSTEPTLPQNERILFPKTVSEKEELPPKPHQLIEAMLFIGGVLLDPVQVCQSIRGATVEQVELWVRELNVKYEHQKRPYHIVAHKEGYCLEIRKQYQPLKTRIHGGTHAIQLPQATLEVLSLVAYRQPITRVEVDRIRDSDSNSNLRQLLKLGLVSTSQIGTGKQKETVYSTTPRFLEVFNLLSLDDLPKIGPAEAISIY